MTNAPNRLTSLLHHLGVTGPARVRVVGGSSAPKISVLALLLAITATTALSAASAQAEIYHPFLSSFDGSETPAKSFTPVGIGVDKTTGDVYVTDENTAVVNKFSGAPGAKYLSQLTGTPEGPFGFLPAVAVDPATGDVYVVEQSGRIDKFDSTGNYLSEIPGVSAAFPGAVAVDEVTGDVYFVNQNNKTVEKFDPSSSTLSVFATEATGTAAVPFGTLGGVAVDNSVGPSAGDVYVVDEINKVVDKFDSTGTYLSQLEGTGSPGGTFRNVAQIAVDPSSGDVYVTDEANGGLVDEFNASGSFLGQTLGSSTPAGSMQPAGVAVAAGGEVYVSDREHAVVDVFGAGVVVPYVKTEGVSAVTATTATVAGTVNAEGVALTSCEFEYGTSEAYGQTAPCEPDAEQVGSGTAPVPVTAKLPALESGVTYHYRLEAANANGVARYGKDATVTTLPRPTIDSATVSALTASSAILNAKIDPNGYQLKECYFEYGTDTSYGYTQPCTPAATIPPDTNEHSVSASIDLPEPELDKTYHWRVVATNANGTVGLTVDHTFVYDTSGEGLPDNRAYEMVTPPQKNGALIGDAPVLGLPPAVSEDGSRVMAPSIQCFAGAQSCTAKQVVIATPYQFLRTTGGWQASALAPPASVLSSSSTENYGENGAVLFAGPTPPHEEDDFYARLPETGSLFDVGPLTPPEAGARGPDVGILRPYGTADLSHIVWTPFIKHSAAEPQAWPEIDKTSGEETAYEYVGVGSSRPLLVGVDDSGNLISTCETRVGGDSGEQGAAALSADGHTVYFTAVGIHDCGGSTTSPPVDEVFARINNGEAGAHTVAISEPSSFATAAPYPGCEAEPCIEDVNVAANFRDGWFVDASADGSKAFFTSTQQLTDGASEDPSPTDTALDDRCETTVGAGGCNLYEHDSTAPAGHQLIDLSAGDSSGGGPRVQGVVAISPDGSHVYFVAHGVLTTAANSQGQTARDGAENLYLSQGGHATFIATLPASDAPQWEFSDKRANVTPEGRFLVFMSNGDLTPDDTSRSGALQVFRYDAETNELIRISIGNDGYDDNGNRSSPASCKGAGFGCSEDASIVHGYERHLLGVPRRDPTMSNDGAYVFFQSPVALTSHALDDVQIATEESGAPVYAQNVYEWKEQGMGSCTQVAGCVSLISDGRDVSRAGTPVSCPEGPVPLSSVCLLGSDATGSNVFFTTADPLVPADTDTELDIYDARICEPEKGNPCIQPSLAPSSPCLGEACHGIPAGTPSLLTPGTVSFNGAGNIAPVAPAVKKKTVKCKRGDVKSKKGRCVKKPRKKRNKAKKSAHINRRASR